MYLFKLAALLNAEQFTHHRVVFLLSLSLFYEKKHVLRILYLAEAYEILLSLNTFTSYYFVQCLVLAFSYFLHSIEGSNISCCESLNNITNIFLN